MVERIGSGGSAKAIFEAAMKRQAELRQKLERPELNFSTHLNAGTQGPPVASDPTSGFLSELNNNVRAADQVTEQVLTGQVTDFASAAAQLRQSDLSFRFALEVRNKFVDAYREVMRMSV